MKYRIVILMALTWLGCSFSNKTSETVKEKTPEQERLLEQGWYLAAHKGEEFDERMGVKPIHGTQDNYFDIEVGDGLDIAIKIVDAETDKCIRYVYAPQNEVTTINDIPQGRYYVKIAYGNDWMEFVNTDVIYGKFTRNVFFEKSNVFDYGKKNSLEDANYRMSINKKNGIVSKNFSTMIISEEEFESN